jgi:hypothetical protein
VKAFIFKSLISLGRRLSLKRNRLILMYSLSALAITSVGQGCGTPFNSVLQQNPSPSLGGVTPPTPPGNNTFDVEAGADVDLSLPNRSAQLTAVANGNFLSVAWSQISGPGTVTFSSVSALQTFVTFPGAGAYELQVAATGALSTATDTLRVRVTSTPNGTTFAVPSDNQGQWRPGIDVGVEGGIHQYLVGGVNDRAVKGRVLNIVTQYNGDPTGAQNVKPAVLAALNDAQPGDVIYFPAGTFTFREGFIYSGYKEDITIRGAGVGLTTLHGSTSGPIFIFSEPGEANGSSVQEILSAKTKGLNTITVADASGYSAGRRATILYENEDNPARIIAGANPVWTSAGWPNARQTQVMVQAVAGNTITIDPPLVTNAGPLKAWIGTHPNAPQGTNGWGFEDFTVTADRNNHPTAFAIVGSTAGTWFYNIHFKDFSRNSSNGSWIKMGCYRCEIRRCRFDAVPGSSSDGAIETGGNSNVMIVDNIFSGDFGNAIYDSGNSTNTYIAYNYAVGTGLSIFHNAHPSLNLVEGNVGPTHQSDGYHGSSSNNTFYRNWLYSGFGVILNRFKRDYVIVGNVFGHEGVTAFGGISYGNPNMGNGAADGFAGPTGGSVNAGMPDYLQPGYGPNTYLIKPEDISVGDFWVDWNVTGTLVQRLSDTEAVFTMSGGNWFLGPSQTGGSQIYPAVHWNNKLNRATWGTVTNVSGLNITISWGPGTVLPQQGTSVQVYFGPAGWQERDLDVQASSTEAHNFNSKMSGGEISNPLPNALPASLAYSSKPTWWNDNGFTGSWPPVDPNAPVFSPSIIPAGARYLASP